MDFLINDSDQIRMSSSSMVSITDSTDLAGLAGFETRQNSCWRRCIDWIRSTCCCATCSVGSVKYEQVNTELIRNSNSQQKSSYTDQDMFAL